jgi:hypothetical protein
VSLEGVGAHLAVASSVRELPDTGQVFCHSYVLQGRHTEQAGPVTVSVGCLQLEHLLTRERLDALYCVLHFGEADFRCGLVPYRGPEHLAEVESALLARPHYQSLAHLLREADRFFPGRDYGLRDLFLDERRRVADMLLDGTLRRNENTYRAIFEDNQRLMEFLREIDSPIPGPLRVAADVTLTGRLLRFTAAARAGVADLSAAGPELEATVELAQRLGAHLHLSALRLDVGALAVGLLDELLAGSAPGRRAVELARSLDLAKRLGLALDMWDLQNRLWEWAGSGRVAVDREVALDLARSLWFDERTLLRRAGHAE